MPLSALQLDTGSIYVTFRLQQQIWLLEIVFDHASGEQVCDICWFAPIHSKESTLCFDSMAEIQAITKQYILLLPRLDMTGKHYKNCYHAISNKWMEGTQSGVFERTEISEGIFEDWKA
jgi:hypothetical protein